jgi:hypothetical protein
MKRLLLALLTGCLLLFLRPAGALAVDPLDGAFGLKFGDVFVLTGDTPHGVVRTDEHARLPAYQFQPAAQNRIFTEYWVYLTPTTHRIYRIVAVGHANNADLAASQQEAAFSVAREKYYGDFSTPDRVIVQGTRSVSVRPATVQTDGSVLWQIAYTDMALAGRIMTANNGTYEEVDDTGL